MSCEIKVEAPEVVDILVVIQCDTLEESFSTGREFQRRIKKELPNLNIIETKFKPYTLKVRCELGSFKNTTLIILALRERFLEELERAKA